MIGNEKQFIDEIKSIVNNWQNLHFISIKIPHSVRKIDMVALKINPIFKMQIGNE